MKDVFPESLGQKHGCTYTQVGSFVSKLACKPFKAETHRYHTTHITWQKVSYKKYFNIQLFYLHSLLSSTSKEFECPGCL